jgi:hypothetical protein
LGIEPGSWSNLLLWIRLLLSGITLLNRARNGLAEVNEKAQDAG